MCKNPIPAHDVRDHLIYIRNKLKYFKNKVKYGKVVKAVTLSFYKFFHIRQT